MTAPAGVGLIVGWPRRLTQRIQGTPVLHLTDQALSSATNVLAVVIVARNGTPEQFGTFSIFLIAYYVTIGFNRSVPHAIAMTLEWDDERARSLYFFLPPLVTGALGTAVLVPVFASMDPSFLALSFLLIPMLLQDAVRMHAFATQRPLVAIKSDVVWLAAEVLGFLFIATGPSAALVWAVGGLSGLLVTRPWLIRMRYRRRPIVASAASAALEYLTQAGLGYATPLLAVPIITVLGVGALQGAGVIRGPIILLVQGLVIHRMSGPPISRSSCVREALQLSAATLGMTVVCIPPLILLQGFYGPFLLGATWPSVQPLVLPAIVTMGVASIAFGPATTMRKMGRFTLSAKVQIALAPLFVAFPLTGAAMAGTKGFFYATAMAYAVYGITWWNVLARVARGPTAAADVAVV